MSKVTVTVSPEIWRWVLATVNLPDSDQEQIKKWLNNEEKLALSALEKFSQKTHIPFGYFFLNKPPREKSELFSYRTVSSQNNLTPSRDLYDTFHQMENIQDWTREYITDNGGEKNPFVGSIDQKDSVIDLTTKIRQILDLDARWYIKSKDIPDSFNILRDKISSTGVIFMMNGVVGDDNHRQLNVAEFRAFTLKDDYAPLIFINSMDSKGGQLFSLLHEFVHVGLNTYCLFNLGPFLAKVNSLETLCNAVATEILVPSDVFKKKWRDSTFEMKDKSDALSRYFKCSQELIARRALDFGFLKIADYLTIINIYLNFNQKKKKKK
ncbi:MAG: ImmA/IrrE family metallo-endopeptidase [Deltaproteobacteria bacterium]|jgi:Zn-dependent peptidase ImmA (M78 family)|nr:ImmA/IrrE family metallo-endopeptidase [Deltaproteobacteria bacterium]